MGSLLKRYRWPIRISSSYGRYGTVIECLGCQCLILYEAQRQRQNAGMYNREKTLLPDEVVHRILFERGHPVLAKVARRKGLPYPPLDEDGQIAADEQWWSIMQATEPKKKKTLP